MQATNVLREHFATALIAAVAAFETEIAGNLKVVPLTNDFNEDDPGILFADLGLEFAGNNLSVHTKDSGAAFVGRDNVVGMTRVVFGDDAASPAASRYEQVAATLPITVYGYGLLDMTGTRVFALEKLPEPILLQTANDLILFPECSFAIPDEMYR